MSTRGCYGFRINKSDKVTYNHSDSYPTYLGVNVLSFIHDTPESELRDIASRIEIVAEESIPSPELIKAYKNHADTGVSRQSLKDWYCLLRDTQGALAPYRNGLRHMIDSCDFLKDSLFCEWAYIINLDTQELEIYRGFNKRKYVRNGGRYAKYTVDERPLNGKRYYGVTLLQRIPLTDIRHMPLEQIREWCKTLEETIHGSRN